MPAQRITISSRTQVASCMDTETDDAVPFSRATTLLEPLDSHGRVNTCQNKSQTHFCTYTLTSSDKLNFAYFWQHFIAYSLGYLPRSLISILYVSFYYYALIIFTIIIHHRISINCDRDIISTARSLFVRRFILIIAHSFFHAMLTLALYLSN